MASVKTEVADDRVQRPPKGVVFFLLHGSDQGMIHERASRLVKTLTHEKSQGHSLVRIDGDTLTRDPGALRDEALAVDMFGSSKVIWVDSNQRDLSAALSPLFESPPPSCSVVIEAGSLRKGTSLRLLFEQSGLAAAIECYPDERRSLQAMIEEEARSANLDVTGEARDYLISLLGADRLTSRGEISKLMLYCQGLDRVDVGDIEAIVSDAMPSSAERLIEAALMGRVSDVETLASRYFSEEGDAGLIVLRMISSLEMLHELKMSTGLGNSGGASLPPSLFRLPPHQRSLLTEGAKRWSPEALRRRLLWSREILAKVRGRPATAASVATRALWALASSARPRSG